MLAQIVEPGTLLFSLRWGTYAQLRGIGQSVRPKSHFNTFRVFQPSELLRSCPSTGSNCDHLLQADFTGLIPSWKPDSFWLADDTGTVSPSGQAIAGADDRLTDAGRMKGRVCSEAVFRKGAQRVPRAKAALGKDDATPVASLSWRLEP